MQAKYIALLLVTACAAQGSAPDGGDGDSDAGASADADPTVPLPDAAPGTIAVSNGAVTGPLRPTGLTVGAAGSFDTSLGCASPSLLGDCEPVSGGLGPDLCVCRADVMTIGDLEITGDRGLVLLAWERITVNGDLVLRADHLHQGPGARRDYAEATSNELGGAGGSFASQGGLGSSATWGSLALVPLEGGMRGQDACYQRKGGGGGGAIQLSAGEVIQVIGTVNAGGGGGDRGDSDNDGACGGGPGGGSGGAILIEAPAVSMIGTVAANGGGGGGGGGYYPGEPGNAGRPGAEPALGGAGDSGHGCPAYGYTSGGWGGNGAAGETAATSGGPSDWVSGCIGGTVYVAAGGGGGGLGRIRVNTSTGCDCTGTFSPSPSLGAMP